MPTSPEKLIAAVESQLGEQADLVLPARVVQSSAPAWAASSRKRLALAAIDMVGTALLMAVPFTLAASLFGDGRGLGWPIVLALSLVTVVFLPGARVGRGLHRWVMLVVQGDDTLLVSCRFARPSTVDKVLHRYPGGAQRLITDVSGDLVVALHLTIEADRFTAHRWYERNVREYFDEPSTKLG